MPRLNSINPKTAQGKAKLLLDDVQKDTLRWTIPGEEFEDGSKLENWRRIETSPWHWQYDSHELSFGIYEHDGQYWKLYRARQVTLTGTEYEYDFGGQACRMTLVEYTVLSRSPHSSRLMQKGDLEWVRTYEVDETRHRIVKAGGNQAKSICNEVAA